MLPVPAALHGRNHGRSAFHRAEPFWNTGPPDRQTPWHILLGRFYGRPGARPYEQRTNIQGSALAIRRNIFFIQFDSLQNGFRGTICRDLRHHQANGRTVHPFPILIQPEDADLAVQSRECLHPSTPPVRNCRQVAAICRVTYSESETSSSPIFHLNNYTNVKIGFKNNRTAKPFQSIALIDSSIKLFISRNQLKDLVKLEFLFWLPGRKVRNNTSFFPSFCQISQLWHLLWHAAASITQFIINMQKGKINVQTGNIFPIIKKIPFIPIMKFSSGNSFPMPLMPRRSSRPWLH